MSALERSDAESTVLVADDDPMVRGFIRAILEDDGYRVVEAHDGDATLSVLLREQVDAVLLDLNMPGMSGRDVLRALGPEHLHDSGLPVLVVSAEDQPDSVVTELRMGAHDYIRKPFNANELLARVGAAVRVGSTQRKLKGLACTDPLTGLPNRRELQRAVDQAESEARRRSESYSVVMFDIDRFKEINDRFGHAGGDEVLVEVGRVLRRFTRNADTAGRWGGDEFMVVIPRGDEDAAVTVANRIRADIARAVSWTSVTVSAGVAIGPGLTDSSAIDGADRALISAKGDGRDRVAAAR